MATPIGGLYRGVAAVSLAHRTARGEAQPLDEARMVVLMATRQAAQPIAASKGIKADGARGPSASMKLCIPVSALEAVQSLQLLLGGPCMRQALANKMPFSQSGDLNLLLSTHMRILCAGDTMRIAYDAIPAANVPCDVQHAMPY